MGLADISALSVGGRNERAGKSHVPFSRGRIHFPSSRRWVECSPGMGCCGPGCEELISVPSLAADRLFSASVGSPHPGPQSLHPGVPSFSYFESVFSSPPLPLLAFSSPALIPAGAVSLLLRTHVIPWGPPAESRILSLLYRPVISITAAQPHRISIQMSVPLHRREWGQPGVTAELCLSQSVFSRPREATEGLWFRFVFSFCSLGSIFVEI